MSRILAADRARSTSPALTVFVVIVMIFLLAPLVILIPVSLTPQSSLGLPEGGLSLQWYASLVGDAAFWGALVDSVMAAAASTLLAAVLGTPAAYAIERSSARSARWVEAFLMSPLIFPHIVLGLALIVFLTAVGIVRTLPGLVLANLVIAIPYVVRTVLPSVAGVDRAVEEATAVLGASRSRVLTTVVLPNIRSGLTAGLVLSFFVALDEFTIALFITGGDLVTLPVFLYNQTYYNVNPSVAAIGSLLLVVTAAVITAVERTVGLNRLFHAGPDDRS